MIVRCGDRSLAAALVIGQRDTSTRNFTQPNYQLTGTGKVPCAEEVEVRLAAPGSEPDGKPLKPAGKMDTESARAKNNAFLT